MISARMLINFFRSALMSGSCDEWNAIVNAPIHSAMQIILIILGLIYMIILNPQDILVLKKYLIITMLRVKDENLDNYIWYRELI